MPSRDFLNKLLVSKLHFFWSPRYGQRQKGVKTTQVGTWDSKCKAQDKTLLKEPDNKVASGGEKTLNHTRKFNRA